MCPQEFWWEFDAKMAVQKKFTKSRGGFSSAEWDEAWRKHKERKGA